MSSSQPIALPVPAHPQDNYLALGSYTSPSGAFNPASYTRHFLGSPLSWRGGSFEGRFYPAGSPDHVVGSLDQFDLECGKLSSSLESHRGSLVNTFNMFEGDLCRNYTCCGLNLTDLHALLEHFEEVHVVVLDPSAPQQPAPVQYNLVPNYDQVQPSQHYQAPQLLLFSQVPPAYAPEQHSGPFDPNDMELELDTMASTPSSGAPTPPDTPESTPLSSYPSPSGYTQSSLPHTAYRPSVPLRSMPRRNTASPLPQQQQPHVPDSTPIAAFETTVVHALPVPRRPVARAPWAGFPPLRTNVALAAPEEVFNVYAGYSDYSSSMPGAVPSPPASAPEEPLSQGNAFAQRKASPIKMPTGSKPASPYAGCVPPALLFLDTCSTPACTPTVPSVPSPATSRESSTDSSSPVSTARAPASSLLLTSKPYPCPKPNCSKSYKQANGLKYHLTHGQCSFAPPKDQEHVQALIVSNRAAHGTSESGATSPTSLQSPTASATHVGGATTEQGVDGTSLGLGWISKNELRDAECEAERQLRPFACGIGDCQRRYKKMNGLRYHYQHSGEHGAHGLALIANRLHQCLGGSSGNTGSAQNSWHANWQGSQERERAKDKSASGVSTPVQQPVHQPQLAPPPHPTTQYDQQQQQPYTPNFSLSCHDT